MYVSALLRDITPQSILIEEVFIIVTVYEWMQRLDLSATHWGALNLVMELGSNPGASDGGAPYFVWCFLNNI
jgi:hypothetical protein